jgi:hypothetical protein
VAEFVIYKCWKMLGDPLRVHVAERVILLLIEDKWLADGDCDLKTALKESEGRNIYCNTPNIYFKSSIFIEIPPIFT